MALDAHRTGIATTKATNALIMSVLLIRLRTDAIIQIR